MQASLAVARTLSARLSKRVPTAVWQAAAAWQAGGEYPAFPAAVVESPDCPVRS
jgi:hypothetical protein